MDTDTIGRIAKALEAMKAEIVHLGIFDYSTMFRERRLHRADLLASTETAMFANVLPKWDSAEQILFPGPFGSEAIALDPDSIRPYPFEPNAALIVADYVGPQAPIMPRAILAKQIARSEALGHEALAAFEFEFIVLEETAETLRAKNFAGLAQFAPDNRCWSGQTAAAHAGFVADLEAMLKQADIAPYSLGVELGPGCFEATLRHGPAMRAADDAACFRMFTRAYCRQRGRTASFMAFLGAGYPGIGGHIALSLRDPRDGRNLFAAPGEPYGLSTLGRSFLAGIIDVVPEAFLLCAQNVNAYRRFAPGTWAPKTMSWAPNNYAAAVRLMAETPTTTRLEFRLPGADHNVFLGLALMLGAGLDGIERGLELETPPIASGGPAEIPAGAPRLPIDLLEATRRIRASEKAKRIFGPLFVEHFAQLCEAEDAALRRAVSAEETARYLEGG